MGKILLFFFLLWVTIVACSIMYVEGWTVLDWAQNACNHILDEQNRVMNKIKEDALDRINKIAWDDNPDAEMLLKQIQATLYEMDQMLDHRSDMMHGDDDAHINSPNMRRC